MLVKNLVTKKMLVKKTIPLPSWNRNFGELALKNEFDEANSGILPMSRISSKSKVNRVQHGMSELNHTVLLHYNLPGCIFFYPLVNGCTQKSGQRPEHNNAI